MHGVQLEEWGQPSSPDTSEYNTSRTFIELNSALVWPDNFKSSIYIIEQGNCAPLAIWLVNFDSAHISNTFKLKHTPSFYIDPVIIQPWWWLSIQSISWWIYQNLTFLMRVELIPPTRSSAPLLFNDVRWLSDCCILFKFRCHTVKPLTQAIMPTVLNTTTVLYSWL